MFPQLSRSGKPSGTHFNHHESLEGTNKACTNIPIYSLMVIITTSGQGFPLQRSPPRIILGIEAPIELLTINDSLPHPSWLDSSPTDPLVFAYGPSQSAF